MSCRIRNGLTFALVSGDSYAAAGKDAEAVAAYELCLADNPAQDRAWLYWERCCPEWVTKIGPERRSNTRGRPFLETPRPGASSGSSASVGTFRNLEPQVNSSGYPLGVVNHNLALLHHFNGLVVARNDDPVTVPIELGAGPNPDSLSGDHGA